MPFFGTVASQDPSRNNFIRVEPNTTIKLSRAIPLGKPGVRYLGVIYTEGFLTRITYLCVIEENQERINLDYEFEYEPGLHLKFFGVGGAIAVSGKKIFNATVKSSRE